MLHIMEVASLELHPCMINKCNTRLGDYMPNKYLCLISVQLKQAR